MAKRTTMVFSVIIIGLLIGTFLAACGTSSPGGTSNSGGASSGTDGASLLQSRCSVCHSLSRVTSVNKSAADWKITVDRMITHGAQLNAAEEQTLVGYLATKY